MITPGLNFTQDYFLAFFHKFEIVKANSHRGRSLTKHTQKKKVFEDSIKSTQACVVQSLEISPELIFDVGLLSKLLSFH